MLNTFSSFDISSIKLLEHLKDISSTLSTISSALPEFFTNGLDFSGGKKNECVMLREWELESEHDYGNNMNFSKVMSPFLLCIISISVLRKLCENAFFNKLLLSKLYIMSGAAESFFIRILEAKADDLLEENPPKQNNYYR